MACRLVVLALFIFAVSASGALADGPLPVAQQGGPGVLSSDGSLRYLALNADANTVLAQVQTKDGQLRNETTLLGSYGIPMLTYGTLGEGLSRDGRTLIVGNADLATPSRFLVLDARTLRTRNWIVLQGSFAFDALSPDASRLYLIQHLNSDYAHYVVRAYDLLTNRLLPGRIADRTQKSWVMAGYPLTRTVSADGRWVYTLYQNAGDGYPFVHALDTVKGVAHCIGVPLSDQSGVYNLVLSLRNEGRMLAVHWKSGRPWLEVNTATWRITHVRPGAFPWRWVGIALGGVLALVAAALLVRRRAAGPVSVPAV